MIDINLNSESSERLSNIDGGNGGIKAHLMSDEKSVLSKLDKLANSSTTSHDDMTIRKVRISVDDISSFQKNTILFYSKFFKMF